MENKNELNGLTPVQNIETSLQISAEFLRAYGFNVLPVVGKNPSAFGEWTKFYSRLQTFEELNAYDWKRATGIAVVLGTGDIRSIDVDAVKDETIIKDLLAQLGLPPDYEWVEKTGCGNQVFFICSAEGRNDSRNCLDQNRAHHFELRWKQCISVAPPSQHYDKQNPPQPDGKLYSWLHCQMPTGKPATLELSVVEKAFKAFTKENPPREEKKSNGEFDNDSVIGRAVAEFNMRDYLTARGFGWQDERDGQVRIEYQPGHDSLIWSDELHCAKFWKDEKAMSLLNTLEYLEACKVGKEPIGYSALSSEDKQNIKDVLSQYSGVSLDVKLKIVDAVALIPDDDKFMSEAIFRADAIGDVPDPVDWIVKDVLATQECFGLFGLPGEGKSYAALQLAISVASGNVDEWLGFKIEKTGSVLYILNDGSMTSLRNRIRYISNYLHIPKPRNLMVLKKQGVFASWKESVDRIINIEHPVLIVVDSLSMVANSKDENSVAEQMEFGTLLNEWSLKYKLNVLTIHHSNKASADRAMGLVNWRGSSYWAGMMSSMMEFRKVSDTGRNKYKIVKSRDGGEDALGVRECAYEKDVRKDGTYDLGGVNPPSGYKYVGKAIEAIPGTPSKVGKPKQFFPKLDDIFALGESKGSKTAIEAIMIKYGCQRNSAINALKEWVADGEVLKHKATTGGVSYERKG
jgi:hypothetical protein